MIFHPVIPAVLLAGSAVANTPSQIANVKDLTPVERESLLTTLQPKPLLGLPTNELEALQQAAPRFSESAIGRRLDGRLIEVTEPTEKRLLQIAGEYRNPLPLDKVPAIWRSHLHRHGKPHPIDEPSFVVKISNAVAAPGFKLGSTSPEQWKSSRRSASPPYVGVVSDRIALSFPSEWIRTLDDPTELLRFWDRIVELHDDLGGLTHLRTCPERVNVDVQISAGLFHAGYPMQGPQQACAVASPTWNP